MYSKLKRITAIFLSVLISLSAVACEEKPKTESETQSSASVNVSYNIAEEDDTKDPENIENTQIDDGAKVDFAEIQDKKGLQNGIDVSKWQGKIDWQQVKNAGVDFAIIRIGYRAENGKLYRDSNADYNIQQAQKHGILVGVYFFSTAINQNEAIEEAEWTVSAIKSYQISYPVVYDCEGFKNNNSRMYSLTAEQRSQNALSFLDTVKKSGYEGMFYGSKSDLTDIAAFNIAEIERKYKIWVAQYKNPPYPQSQKPDYSGRYDMWQYTNKGVVSGINGNCDMVVSYFEKKTQAPKDDSVEIITAQPPKTQEELLYTDVNEDVTAKDEVNLRSGAGTNFDVVAVLKNGTVVKRNGVGKNGWSRLNYEGQTVYAITSYLTTDLNIKPEPKPDIVEGNTFSAQNDNVTAKQEVNLRRSPTTTGEIVGVLKNGTVLQRTATSNKGWSRLVFEGQTVYAITSYLTTDISYKPPVDDGIKTEFQTVNEQVTAKSETNLRTLPSVTDSQVVYTLKNGEYLTRTGISTNGWSRLEYNGQTVYAVSSYLTE
ncbi:MAG: SH3 domain-containing protein [Clostridia bacterium]|nr:SH3 domain-containing protein [Clostridia bacterium]